jgi:serine/threonine protein kinase
MGVVYRARQIALDLTVALKVISPELAGDSGFRSRFQDEARLAASLEHPNVLPVRDAGEERGLLYISMRFVQGTDLRRVIEDAGRLKPGEVAAIANQVASALDAAHAHGLVHRDVKPENVLIEHTEAGPHAYLADFGLTKDTASQSGLTGTGTWVGTLDYVAPEQVLGEPVDARADVYALGCMVFQMLSGRVPFDRDSDIAKLWAHVHDPPPPLDPALGLDQRYDEVLARAMANDPDERYPSAGDLGRALQAAVGGEVVMVPERSVAQGRAANPQLGSTQTPRSPTPRKRLAIGAVMIGLLAAIAVAAIAVGNSGSGARSHSGSGAGSRAGSGAGSQQAGLGTAIGQLNKIPRAASLSASLNTTSKKLVNVITGHGSASTIQPEASHEVFTARQLLASTTPPTAPPTASFSASGHSLNTSLQSLYQAALTLQNLQRRVARLCRSNSCSNPTNLAQIKHDQAQLAKIHSVIKQYDREQSAALTNLRTTITSLNHQLSQLHLLDQAERQQLHVADSNINTLHSSAAATTDALNKATATKTQTLAAAATALTRATAPTTPTRPTVSTSRSAPSSTGVSSASSNPPAGGSGSSSSGSGSAPAGGSGSSGQGSGSTPIG